MKEYFIGNLFGVNNIIYLFNIENINITNVIINS